MMTITLGNAKQGALFPITRLLYFFEIGYATGDMAAQVPTGADSEGDSDRSRWPRPACT